MHTRPKLSVLIVTHNKPELAGQLALSIALAKDTPEDTELLVYQSGIYPARWGENRSLKTYIQSICGYRFSRVLVVEDPLNLGCSIGFNSLIELARGELLLLLNEDMVANTNGWFAPLEAQLVQGVGLVCSHIINGGMNFSIIPLHQEAKANIAKFSDAYKGLPTQPSTLVETESNQPWLVRARDIPAFAMQDPIVNQRKWICNWSDPSGCFWACDWNATNKIRLAGYKVGMVPQSIFYHYDHVTVREKDKAEPGWTQLPLQRYGKLWNLEGKIQPGFDPAKHQAKFCLIGEELIPYAG